MSRRRWQQVTPYLLLFPSTIFILVFFAYPMAESFALAFRTDEGAWTLKHFATMISDVAFVPAMRTTLLLVIVIIPVQFFLALVMALLIQAKLKFSSIFLYIYSIPLGISELAAGIVWFALFTERGYINSILINLGLLKLPFIFLSYENTSWLIAAIVLAEAWRATSIIMIILVAGLQSIPNEYLEAADVFGASPWDKVWRVILPLLKPSLQVALILRTILAFQVFAVALAVAGSGLTLLAAEAYFWYNTYRNPHVAAALATLIMVLSIISTIFYLWGLHTPEEQSL